ncbi:MAG: LuxR C-terminal-related transcriptional regulator [Pseudonocardiaceae bacterium]
MTRVIENLESTRRLMPGRVRELGALQAERQRSALGELRVALVLGEAGLGKTRLAAEGLPRGSEWAIGLVARNSPLGDIPPFGPWAAALNLHDDDRGSGRACRACGSGFGGLPALERRAEIGHDASSCAQTLRHHLVEWMPGLLAKASADRPVVVILDDAHRAHDAVWEMLLRLAWDSPDSRLLVVVTARPAELARRRIATEVLQVLEQEALISRLVLAPLSRADVAELAADILGPDRTPAELVDWLMAHAQGNPRLVVGLLEAVVNNGADLRAPVLNRIPDRLARWVRTEVARHDPPAVALVELIAVAGDLVALGDLVQITGRPIDDIALTMEYLVRCGAVAEQRTGATVSYQLTCRLTREVVYAGIGGIRRHLMHRQWAATLRAGGRTEAAAPHYVRAAQAGDSEAIDALIEMAAQTVARGVSSQSWRTISRLQDLLPIGDDRWLGVFDSLVQESSWGIVDRTEYHVIEIAAVRRMRQLLAGITDLQRQVDVRLWLAGLFSCGAGDLDAGERECSQALALCRGVGRGRAGRAAAVELAKIRGWHGDLCGAELAAREQLAEAERAGDQRALAEALAALGHTLGWQGRFDAAEEVLLRSVELGTAAGRLSWSGQSLALLASLDACRGHLVSARTRWAQAAALRPHHDPMLSGCGAFIELVAGDLPMVTAHAQQCEGHGSAAGSCLPAAGSCLPAAGHCLPIRLAGRVAMAAAERGQLAEAREDLDAMTRSDSKTLGVLEPLYWWASGVVARAEGRLAAAAAALQRTVDCYAAMNAWALRGFVLADLAEVSVAAGDYSAATQAAESAHNTARRTDALLHQVLSLLATAWALIGQGHRDQAAEVALRAVEGFRCRGYALLAARSQVAYATAVGGSDRTAAKDVLREAIRAFDTCGAIVRRGEARALLHGFESEQPCTPAAVCGPDSLTRRERQVAELAAGGYTAAQIATQLHIGVRTVETHLARGYAKLGVSSKQQLVLRRAELGMSPEQ